MASSSPDKRPRDPLFDPPGFSPRAPYHEDTDPGPPLGDVIVYVVVDILTFGIIPMSILFLIWIVLEVFG